MAQLKNFSTLQAKHRPNNTATMSNNNTDKEKELKARQEKILQDLKALEERYHQVSPLKGAVENRVFNAGVQMGVTQ